MAVLKEQIKTLLDTKFIKVFDLQYAEGKHYYDASRNSIEKLAAIKSDDAFKKMTADAVTCYVVLKIKNEEPKLLLHYEYRYPVGRYMLSIPAGLIDEADHECDNPLIIATKRELEEETGLVLKPSDKVFVINPCVFSTPGMTDESNALVGVIAEIESEECLKEDGAVGTEDFAGFCLVTKAEAQEILKRGTDEHGNYFPMYTWGALVWFATGLWEDDYL